MQSVSSAKLIYHLVQLIPSGKVITYGLAARLTGVNSAQAVGQILHRNRDPAVPCYKVVFANGQLSDQYAFGGKPHQARRLLADKVRLASESQVDLSTSLWQPHRLLYLYFDLVKTHGWPGAWPWFGQPAYSQSEIILSSVLTQNTNWRNVHQAITNLRQAKLNRLQAFLKAAHDQPQQLQQLIRPAGFYRQKLATITRLLDAILPLPKIHPLATEQLRRLLLDIKGIGPETADTLLLYGFNRPVFVVDRYTLTWLRQHKLLNTNDYHTAQAYFTKHLPINLELIQNFHALIVQAGKTNNSRTLPAK